MNTSPSGSLCPYYYLNGELHPLKYGSFRKDREKLFAIIKAEEEFIQQSAGLKNRLIWIDLYKTDLTPEVMYNLVIHIYNIRLKISKLCMVGCSIMKRHAVKKLMKKYIPELAERIQFFSDPEEAKRWLIGKGQHEIIRRFV
ncbi:MAG: hypothetical protein JW982_06535 [Spirochaetes bacterium]|nr:hypothetical protein [Spirochaetota bacterium]